MAKLILKNGSEYDCHYEGIPWVGEVNFTLVDMELQKALLILSNEENTEDMTIVDGGEEVHLHGYTIVQALVKMGNNVRCVMKQGDTA